MDALIERCGGLDVHRDTVAACVRVPGANGKRQQEVRTFGTTAAELLALRDWLEAHGVTHVAMESTGVYWKPVFYVLEDAFTCLLVNATHIKQVPGRKTDVKDCVWIAQCLECGLLRGSFVPPAPIRELRDLTRHRRVLSHAANPHAVAMQVYAAAIVYNALRVAQSDGAAQVGWAPERLSPAKFFPKVATATYLYLHRQQWEREIRTRYRRLHLRLVGGRRCWVRATPAPLEVEHREDHRRTRRFCPARRRWKSFAHVRGGRRFTKLS